MTMADVLVTVEAAVADAACPTVVMVATTPIDDMLRQVRGSRSPMIVVLAGPDLTDVDRAMLLAAVGPLAIERAPQGRIGALNIAFTASEAAIAAAARFLADAESTTGQILVIA